MFQWKSLFGFGDGISKRPESCFDKILVTTGLGVALGTAVGGAQAMLASPPALERAAIIGAAAAKAQLPKYSTYMRQNAFLFGAVGLVSNTGKCLAEGITGSESPLNAGLGGAMTGAFLGIYKGSIPVLLGASAGFFVLGVIADVNGPNLLQDPEKFHHKIFGVNKAPQ